MFCACVCSGESVCVRCDAEENHVHFFVKQIYPAIFLQNTRSLKLDCSPLVSENINK